MPSNVLQYQHTHTHACTRTHTCARTHAHTHTHTHIHTHTYTHTHTGVCTCTTTFLNNPCYQFLTSMEPRIRSQDRGWALPAHFMQPRNCVGYGGFNWDTLVLGRCVGPRPSSLTIACGSVLGVGFREAPSACWKLSTPLTAQDKSMTRSALQFCSPSCLR